MYAYLYARVCLCSLYLLDFSELNFPVSFICQAIVLYRPLNYRQDLSLNAEWAPKLWSRPVDGVAEAAFRHNLAYV